MKYVKNYRQLNSLEFIPYNTLKCDNFYKNTILTSLNLVTLKLTCLLIIANLTFHGYLK